MAGRRGILIVDDNTEAAVTLAMLLQYQGHAVSVAHSGAEALEKVQAVKPDLVLKPVDPQVLAEILAQRPAE